MTLTPREYEVARLFALGWTNERVAQELHVARSTLYSYRSNALAKAGVASMPELWARLGWLRIPGEVDRLALLAVGAIERAEAAIERFNKMRASASDAADLFHPPAEDGSPVVRGFGQGIAMTRRPQ